MTSTSKLIIASNRLPYYLDDKSLSFKQSSGGLISAIMGIHTDKAKLWIGSIRKTTKLKCQAEPPKKINDFSCMPIFINAEDYDSYYNGFCNDVLWPLFHGQSKRVKFRSNDWECYKKVNRIFAERIIQVAQSGDLIWVHDFQLCLVPYYLRKMNPDLKIGWFLHIPCPSFEVYQALSVRKELLQGILAADLVGFQNDDHLHHFCHLIQRVFGIKSTFSSVEYGSRQVALGVFPVSINYRLFNSQSNSCQIKELICEYQVSQIVCLGVDRLDYTKGIDLKIRIFAALLHQHPELHKKVCLIQVALPTRTHVKEYKCLRLDIEQLVSEVNGQYATPSWTPIHYLYHTVTFTELISLYRSSNFLLVTSICDGMNLVALEYVAAQQKDAPGMVLLSEFAGAKSLLAEAVLINPCDIEQTADKLHGAFQMSTEEKQHANQIMQSFLASYTAADWSNNFISKLKQSGLAGTLDRTTLIRHPQEFSKNFFQNITLKEIVIFLDYDGTLVGLNKQSQQAVLNDKHQVLLEQIAQLPYVRLVVISGRDQQFLIKQFPCPNISIVAEHGALFFDKKRWRSFVDTESNAWYNKALSIMTLYASKTPGSYIERKKFCVVWHYRCSPSKLAQDQSLKLYQQLKTALSDFPVRLIHGLNIIEACVLAANKGEFVHWFLQQNPDLTHGLALGDDMTDEDMFSALHDDSFATIKIGHQKTVAQYRLLEQSDVFLLLDGFLDASFRNR